MRSIWRERRVTRRSTSSVVIVAMQIGLIALGGWPLLDIGKGHWWGALVIVAGVALGLWTLAHNRLGNFSVFPEPTAAAKLITSGPYGFVRHPMYTSLLIFMLGVLLYVPSVVGGVALVALTALLFYKTVKEERYLESVFPDYAVYRQRTQRFFPFV